MLQPYLCATWWYRQLHGPIRRTLAHRRWKKEAFADRTKGRPSQLIILSCISVQK